jgi:hypothetical protein
MLTSNNERKLLASININSPFQVSRYFFDIPEFEEILPPFFNFGDELFMY